MAHALSLKNLHPVNTEANATAKGTHSCLKMKAPATMSADGIYAPRSLSVEKRLFIEGSVLATRKVRKSQEPLNIPHQDQNCFSRSK